MIEKVVRFERKTRYYELHLVHDFFDWVVIKQYGKINSKLGNASTTAFTNYDDALQYFDSESERRLKRHYKIIHI